MRNAYPTTVTISYDLTGKLEYELQSTDFILRDTVYTDKVSYKIDVLEDDFEDFINFLNRITAGKYELEKGEATRLPFDIETK